MLHPRQLNSGTAATVAATNVADPNGDMTATCSSFPAAGSSTSYSYFGTESIEGIGNTGNSATQLMTEVWARGVAGGEVIHHLLITDDFTTGVLPLKPGQIA